MKVVFWIKWFLCFITDLMDGGWMTVSPIPAACLYYLLGLQNSIKEGGNTNESHSALRCSLFMPLLLTHHNHLSFNRERHSRINGYCKYDQIQVPVCVCTCVFGFRWEVQISQCPPHFSPKKGKHVVVFSTLTYFQV